MKTSTLVLVTLVALAGGAYGTGYVLYQLNYNKCYGLSREQIIAIAREQDSSRYRNQLSAVEAEKIKLARVAQFIDWKDRETGYTVYFDISGAQKYLGVNISSACGIHFSHAEYLVPTI